MSFLIPWGKEHVDRSRRSFEVDAEFSAFKGLVFYRDDDGAGGEARPAAAGGRAGEAPVIQAVGADGVDIGLEQGAIHFMAAGESQLGGVGFPGQLLDIGDAGGFWDTGLPEQVVAGAIGLDQADLIAGGGGADIGDGTVCLGGRGRETPV
jgi:hypothetical protein